MYRSETNPGSKEYDNSDISGRAIMCSEMTNGKLAAALMELSRVVRVEVIDGRGDGVEITK